MADVVILTYLIQCVSRILSFLSSQCGGRLLVGGPNPLEVLGIPSKGVWQSFQCLLTDVQARQEQVVYGPAGDAVDAVDVRERDFALLDPAVERVAVDAEALCSLRHFLKATCQ